MFSGALASTAVRSKGALQDAAYAAAAAQSHGNARHTHVHYRMHSSLLKRSPAGCSRRRRRRTIKRHTGVVRAPAPARMRWGTPAGRPAAPAGSPQSPRATLRSPQSPHSADQSCQSTCALGILWRNAASSQPQRSPTSGATKLDRYQHCIKHPCVSCAQGLRTGLGGAVAVSRRHDALVRAAPAPAARLGACECVMISLRSSLSRAGVAPETLFSRVGQHFMFYRRAAHPCACRYHAWGGAGAARTVAPETLFSRVGECF